MELNETFVIPATRDTAWAELMKIDVIAECIPGAELKGIRDDGSYEGSIAFKVGPKRVTFDGTLSYDRDDAARVGHMLAHGGDSRGVSQASARLNFEVVSSEIAASCQVRVRCDVQMTGALASFAESGGVYVGRQLLVQFAENLSARLAGASMPQPNPLPDERPADGPAPSLSPARPAEIKLLPVLFKGLWERIKARFRRDTVNREGS